LKLGACVRPVISHILNRSMELGLTHKVALVIGGASNIGRAIALGFARAGAYVVIGDLDIKQSEKVIHEFQSLNFSTDVIAKSFAIKTDVTDPQQVNSMVKTIIDQLGRIDVLAISVGWTIDDFFLNKTREIWQKEVNVNLWGPINCIHAVLPHMIKYKGGVITTVGSDAGRVGEYKEAVYSACKAGVIALSKALAKEVGRHNIRLNVVCPGVTVPEAGEYGIGSMWNDLKRGFSPEVLDRVSKLYPLRRLGKASDTANSVVWLSSSAASFITGQTLSVSGGYSML